MRKFHQMLQGLVPTAAVGWGLVASLVLLPTAASAQAKLDARYTATLAGLPIGEGTWVISLGEADYSAVATGATTGLMRAFTGGTGQTVTKGTLQAGKPTASTYKASINSYKKRNEINLKVEGGAVRDLNLDPPAEVEPERVPVTDATKNGVLDPGTATIIRMPATGELLAPEACRRNLAIFDGRMRYDLALAYKRMDKVKADKGYEGPVVVCSVRFTPVAGYIPTRAAIKYLQDQRNIEIWLAPINGTRVLVPFRIDGPTPVGRATLEADEFVVTALPAKEPTKASIKPATRAAATETKTP